jgi:LmbE family N-acetylglucosaminyl deacetylase
MFKNKKVIVFAPHPDDETLGCGGYLLKLKKENANISWVIFTEMNKDTGYSHKKVQDKKKQIKKVAIKYGFKNVFELGYSPGTLDKLPLQNLITELTNIIKIVRPNLVLIPHANDIHTDHFICNRAILSSTKSFRNPYIKKLLVYETLSETEFKESYSDNKFIPNYFVDVSKYLDSKINIMKIYKDEIMKEYMPRSISTIKALARYRGSRISVQYAESFMQIINIED